MQRFFEYCVIGDVVMDRGHYERFAKRQRETIRTRFGVPIAEIPASSDETNA